MTARQESAIEHAARLLGEVADDADMTTVCTVAETLRIVKQALTEVVNDNPELATMLLLEAEKLFDID